MSFTRQEIARTEILKSKEKHCISLAGIKGKAYRQHFKPEGPELVVLATDVNYKGLRKLEILSFSKEVFALQIWSKREKR